MSLREDIIKTLDKSHCSLTCSAIYGMLYTTGTTRAAVEQEVSMLYWDGVIAHDTFGFIDAPVIDSDLYWRLSRNGTSRIRLKVQKPVD